MGPRTLLRIACAALIIWSSGALAADAKTRHIVLLFDERPTLPGMAVLEADLVRTLTANSTEPIEVYREGMDLSRFGADDYQTHLRDFLRAKYAGKKIDVAVAIMGPALEFLLRHRDEIFPGTPIIFCGIDRRELGSSLPPGVSGVLIKRQFAPTLQLALKLHPDTKRVVVVAGTSQFDDRLLDDAKAEFRRFEKGLAFEYLTALPLQKLLAELQRMPPQTIVLYSTLFQDGAGAPFVPHDAVQRISAAANAPLYGFLDQYLGHGIVGGNLYGMAAQGEAAARLALRILAGANPSELSFVEPQADKLLFDWRQMQRWGISEDQLPDGSEIRFRPVSAWQQYRWQILLIAAALLAQSLLIAGLLLERRRRHRAEGKARELLSELTHMNRRAGAGELSASIAHEVNQPLAAMVANADAGAIMLREKPPDLEQLATILKEIASEGHRASELIRSLRAMFENDSPKRAPHDINQLVDELLALLRAELERHEISVRSDPTEGLPPVLVDRVQIQQTILNLVMNAMDAMQPVTSRPRILRIRTEADDAYVMLTVEDSGLGVSTENLDQIFQPFFTTKPKGMGMGLSICQSIVKAHGGELTVTSMKPYGTAFQLALPRGNGAREENARRV